MDHIFIDRIDLQVRAAALSVGDMLKQKQEENSADIRARVVKAREIQAKRFAGHKGIYCNAQMSRSMLDTYAALDSECMDTLRKAIERFKLSARAYDRILRVSRTIADLEGNENITVDDIHEAITYRNLDRASWGE